MPSPWKLSSQMPVSPISAAFVVRQMRSMASRYRGSPNQRVKTAVAPLRRGLPIDTPRERPLTS
jgi:hypothetical protein